MQDFITILQNILEVFFPSGGTAINTSYGIFDLLNIGFIVCVLIYLCCSFIFYIVRGFRK